MVSGWRLLSRAGSWFCAWLLSVCKKRAWMRTAPYENPLFKPCVPHLHGKHVTYMLTYMVKSSKYTRGHWGMSHPPGSSALGTTFQLVVSSYLALSSRLCPSWLRFSCLIPLPCLCMLVYISFTALIFLWPPQC